MARSIYNDRRDIAAAEAAGEQLQDGAAPEAVQPGDVDTARAKVTALHAERKAIDERVQQLLNAKRAATSAAERTANAAQYHQDVLAWSAIGDGLSPDGIPGDILTEALQPVNDKLADLAGWRVPKLGADMTIAFGGRAYRLLSESERWRVDALVGAALAEISGCAASSWTGSTAWTCPAAATLLAWWTPWRLTAAWTLSWCWARSRQRRQRPLMHTPSTGSSRATLARQAEGGSMPPPRHQSPRNADRSPTGSRASAQGRCAAEGVHHGVANGRDDCQTHGLAGARVGTRRPPRFPRAVPGPVPCRCHGAALSARHAAPDAVRPRHARGPHTRRRCAAARDHRHKQRCHLEGIGSMSFYTNIARLLIRPKG